MNVNPANQQSGDKLDAVLYAIAPAAEPDTAKLQQQIRSRLTHSAIHANPAVKSTVTAWKLSYGLAAVLIMGAIWFTVQQQYPSAPKGIAVVVYTDGAGVSVMDEVGNIKSASQDIDLHPGMMIETDANSKATFLLSDLSAIRLDASSKVRIQSNHELELESGKLYAHVTPRENGQEKFSVYAGDVNVQVIGTKFEVVRNGPDVDVSVEKGKVKVIAPDSIQQWLEIGNTVSYQNNKLGKLQKIKVESIAMWKNSLVAADTTIVELMVKLFPSRSQDMFK